MHSSSLSLPWTSRDPSLCCLSQTNLSSFIKLVLSFYHLLSPINDIISQVCNFSTFTHIGLSYLLPPKANTSIFNWEEFISLFISQIISQVSVSLFSAFTMKVSHLCCLPQTISKSHLVCFLLSSLCCSPQRISFISSDNDSDFWPNG